MAGRGSSMILAMHPIRLDVFVELAAVAVWLKAGLVSVRSITAARNVLGMLRLAEIGEDAVFRGSFRRDLGNLT